MNLRPCRHVHTAGTRKKYVHAPRQNVHTHKNDLKRLKKERAEFEKNLEAMVRVNATRWWII